MTDPRAIWRRRIVLLWLAGAPTVALLLIWTAVREPLPQLEEIALEKPSASQTDQSAQPEVPQIDPTVFHARLWNSPPESAKPQAQPTVVERPAPLNLQLIGIIDIPRLPGPPGPAPGTGDASMRRAAVYDPETDILSIVGSGERLRQHIVTEIAATYVEFQTGTLVRRLHLEGADGIAPQQSAQRRGS